MKKAIKKTKVVVKKKKSTKKPLKKKVVKKTVKKIIMPLVMKVEGKLVGKVSHYFSDIKVGVIKLSGTLATGDEIRIIGGEATDFNQKITSIQVDHKEIKKAKKGEDVGLKVKEKVREGYKVYKV